MNAWKSRAGRITNGEQRLSFNRAYDIIVSLTKEKAILIYGMTEESYDSFINVVCLKLKIPYWEGETYATLPTP